MFSGKHCSFVESRSAGSLAREFVLLHSRAGMPALQLAAKSLGVDFVF